MKSVLRGLIGADRPKVIAIVTATRAEAEIAIRHAVTGDASMPLKVWCAEDGAGWACVLRGIRPFWAALVIVSWTGGGHSHRATLLKLIPFLIPPFRIVAFNEAGDFFSLRSALLVKHMLWRVRDKMRLWQATFAGDGYSAVYRGAQRVRDIALLAHSVTYRGGERTRDHIVLCRSALYRSAQRARDAALLARSALFRAAERTRDFLLYVWRALYWRGQRARDMVLLIHSAAYRGLQRARDRFMLWWGEVYASAQRMRDAALLAHSAIYRAAQSLRDRLLLAWSAGYRGAERVRDLIVLAAVAVGNAYEQIWNQILRFAAWASPPIYPLVFTAMRRHREGKPAPLPTIFPITLASDLDYDEIRVPARAWSARRFRRSIVASRKTFVVLHRGEIDAEERDKLLRIAGQTNAFSVSTQCAYSGWRNVILHKHPFRRLQPEEVTRVLAPYYSVTVMRRDLLLQLGVPGAFTTGAALMILYWKAAAAGFTSLVCGGDRELTQEPAMPLEDAEFVLRLRLSHRLSRLAPSEAEQLRGNVAVAPLYGRLRGAANAKAPGNPRVLVVSPYLPFPLSHGGAVRIYNLCRELSLEVDFTLVCFREVHETVAYAELDRVFRAVHVVDIDEKFTAPEVPGQVAGYRNSAMTALIRRLCAGGSFDILQLEYTQMAEYSDQAGSVPVILVEHDITFALYRQIAETSADIGAWRQYQTWLRFEQSALRRATSVWTMSESDRRLAVESGAPRGACEVVRNGVDLERFHPQLKRSVVPAILFIGSFRHLPNLLAYELLRIQIMPLVWKAMPQARLHVIAGPLHEQSANAAGKGELLTSDPRIDIEGFVADVRDAYCECDVVAIPVPISAGTNIKVMEAMASGRAAVSTGVGCQGLDLTDGMDIIVRDKPADFADALVSMLRDRRLREEIAANARRTVETRFGWNSIAQTAYRSYETLLENHRRQSTGD